MNKFLFFVSIFAASSIELRETRKHYYSFLFQCIFSPFQASSIVVCKQNDPHINDCVKTAIQAFFQYVSDGEYTFPFDPLNLDTLSSIFEGNIFGGSITALDVKVFGISRSKVTRVNAEISDYSMIISARLFIPEVFVTANAVAQIALGFADVDVNGQCNITMTNVDTEILIAGEVENVGGVDYMRIKKLNLLPNPEALVFSVSNLGV